jgi:predicted nucleic acid-binding protein
MIQGRTLAERGDWLLPVQVLSELASVALRELALYPGAVRVLLLAQRQAAQRVVALTPPVIEEALRGVRQHGMSYYDAQIWAATRLAGGATLLTEDFQHGRELDGVTTLDPFRDSEQ